MENDENATTIKLQGDRPMPARRLTLPGEITDAMIMETLRAVVAERPDYVYRRPDHMNPAIGEDGYVAADCLYVHTAPDDDTDLTPGCLVGVVMHRLGVPLEDLVAWEGKGGFDVAYEYGVSRKVCDVMSDVQSTQDAGRPWRVALGRAEERFPEVFASC